MKINFTKKDFTEAVFQLEDDELNIEDTLKYLRKNLERTLEVLDSKMFVALEDAGQNSAIEVFYDTLKDIDLYQIGDVINLLDFLEKKMEEEDNE